MIKKEGKEEEVRSKAKKPQQFGRVQFGCLCYVGMCIDATIITDYIMENYC